MIEISFGKLVLLALVALIVLGPEKLPGAARTAGALLRRVRNGWDSVRAEVERELEVEEIKRTAREAAARAEAAQNEFKESMQQVRQPVEEAAETLKSAAAPAPAIEESRSEAQQSLPLGEPPATTEAKEPAHGGH
ncbi:Sec-independent protein translocase protein TatB [Rhodanobacter sp. DHG33]|uniref:Sec-independent protein translocase protein TatB n=1 Tax=Rhodanobacter sp. DHG33 TaxID=2775921 RepID=UPI00177C891E|nr:Sec-independent protein translocase protein TatB [Rhodanobacter sp. DHG33]MBD8897736.1 twin-arginine translocase subunit TatB [Rhodanobacter sp. DHG33]